MGLTRLAIHRPIAILMLVAAILVVGLIGYFRLPAELSPDVSFPTITIVTRYAGTNPQEMETLITKPVEDSISGVSGIQEIDSFSQEGESNVRIQFYFGTDLPTADAQVIQKVDAIRSRLPVQASSPSVQEANSNGRPILSLAMQSNIYSQVQLQSMAVNIVQPALEQGTDVAAVNVSQVSTRELHVDVNPSSIAAYGITLPQVVTAIGNANVNVASGSIQYGPQYYDVRLVGELTSVDELRNLRLNFGGTSSSSSSALGFNGSGATGLTQTNSGLSSNSSSSSSGSHPIYLKDIATVSDTIADPTTASFYNGHPAVQIQVLLATNGNTLQAVQSCQQELKRITPDLPQGVFFDTSFDQSKQVTQNLADVVTSLFLGAILAILVVYIFLHNARGTLIVAIAIPTSMIATFVPMWALGFTLNQMSLLGLSLAVGILVDDSIVVLENINRHLQLGEEPVVAAINGRTEIGLAALVLTSVDLVVFLPIAFMGGVIGLLYRSFAMTVAFATLFSLFVSFTLTPMLAARWYRKGESLEASDRFSKGFDRFFLRIEGSYQNILRWGIRHPWWVVGVVNLLIVGVFVILGPQLGFRFAPSQDQGRVSISVEAPAGSSVAYTENITRQIENVINTTPDLHHDTQHISTQVGNSGPGLDINGTQYAHVDLTLYDRRSFLDTITFWKHDHLRDRADVDVARELTKKLKNIVGARILPSNVSGFGGGGAPLVINLTGPDQNKLVAGANKVMDLMKSTPGVYNVDSSFQTSQPEVQVRLDRTLAPEYGLTLQGVANTLATSVAGDATVQYRDPADGQQYNIRVELAKPYRSTPSQIADVVIGYTNGKPIRLGDVAQITIGSGPVQLTRLNRQREVQVTAYVLPGYSVGRLTLQLMPKITAMHLSQVHAVTGGESQQLSQELPYLVSAFFLGIILTYMLMAALFNNLVYPFSIMLSLPQAWAGGVIALFLAHQQLSIISMMGVVLLNAIVNKNAILLVDYTNTLRARGYKREDALMLAGPTRLRPILMTSFTIIVSTLPTALALGRGAGFRQSLGIVVEGGIILSLLLTLVVVPSAYIIYDNLTQWLAGRLYAFNTSHNISAEQISGDAYADQTMPPPVDDVPESHPAPVGAGVQRSNGSATQNGNGSQSSRVDDGRNVTKPSAATPEPSSRQGNGDGNGSARSGKYGRMVIRSRRPDDLFQRHVKGDGRDGDDGDRRDPRRN